MKIDRQKLRVLIIGTIGIYSLYFIGSVIQQRIMKVPYQNLITSQKQNFESLNSFVLVPSLISWLIGYLYNNFYKPRQKPLDAPAKQWLKPAALIVFGTYLMNKAIFLTNYPLVTLFKSCNLLSVIFVGLFCSQIKEKKLKLQKRQLIIGFVVTIGVLMYYFGPILQIQEQQYSKANSYLGIILLTISLLFDGLIPDFQASLKQNYKPSTFDLFQHTNKWKSFITIIYSLVTLEFVYLYNFFVTSPQCFLHLIILSLTGAIGQIFVYWLINSFRQHVVPFIITTRKIITVGISIVYFGHSVGLMQIVGILVVLIAVFFEFYSEIKSSTEDKVENVHVSIEQQKQNTLSNQIQMTSQTLDQQSLNTQSEK